VHKGVDRILDILGMVNDYIKNNKSDDQLAHEFIILINKGYTIEIIAKQYDYTPEKVKAIIDQSGLTKGTETQAVNSSSKMNESKTDNKPELKISIDIVIDVLNDGVDLDKIAKQYNISGRRLKELILLDGYRYYSFMNFWTKMNQEELIDYLVKELNQGFSLYDLSAKYVKNNKDRLSFVYRMESYLKRYKFIFNLKSKKWTRGDQPSPAVPQQPKIDPKPIQKPIATPITLSNLKKIVIDLNKEIPIKDVAESFNTTPQSIRQDLKKNGYRYDRIFNVWTQEKRSDLVKKLASDLTNGRVTAETLKRNGLNTNLLEVELRFGGFDENIIRPVQKNKISSKQNNETTEVLKSIKNKENTIAKTKNMSQPLDEPAKSTEINRIPTSPINELSKKEVEILKEILFNWQQKKIEVSGLDNNPAEINIFIEQDLLIQLTKASEISGISKSLVIANALREYLKK
jgi:hypothetical protein